MQRHGENNIRPHGKDTRSHDLTGLLVSWRKLALAAMPQHGHRHEGLPGWPWLNRLRRPDLSTDPCLAESRRAGLPIYKGILPLLLGCNDDPEGTYCTCATGGKAKANCRPSSVWSQKRATPWMESQLSSQWRWPGDHSVRRRGGGRFVGGTPRLAWPVCPALSPRDDSTVALFQSDRLRLSGWALPSRTKSRSSMATRVGGTGRAAGNPRLPSRR